MPHQKNCNSKNNSRRKFSRWKKSKSVDGSKFKYRDLKCKECGGHLGREYSRD